MPLFYIHFRHGDLIAKDDEGVELPGLEQAVETALLSAREIIADEIKSNAKTPLRAVIIAGESGQDLLTIPARDLRLSPTGFLDFNKGPRFPIGWPYELGDFTNARGSGVDSPIHHANPGRRRHRQEVPHTRAVPDKLDIPQQRVAAALQ